jgi:SnoaL-like domain
MGGNRELAERFIASLEARDWDAWAELLHPAVVYEIPQSRERIRGRDRYLRFNQEYPGDWHLRPKVTIADERHGVVWFEWLLDGRADDAMAFFEFADGLITRVTDFWPEPYEPPPGRGHLVERWLLTPGQRQPAQSRAGRRWLRITDDPRTIQLSAEFIRSARIRRSVVTSFSMARFHGQVPLPGVFSRRVTIWSSEVLGSSMLSMTELAACRRGRRPHERDVPPRAADHHHLLVMACGRQRDAGGAGVEGHNA